VTAPPVTAEQIRTWGRHAQSSPLYARLVEVVAGDPGLLKIINQVEHQPRPNMLFAAVHYLLMAGMDHPLSRFYASLVTEPESPEEVDAVFRDFVITHESEIVEIGRTRYTQTNECRRCVALVPALWEAPFDAFHLVELGSAAGLNLAFDRYRYRWGDLEWGPDSPVLLEAESRGETPRPRDVGVLSRTGIDVQPVDPGDPDQRLWLQALIWPEHHERRRRLAAALEAAAGVDVELRQDMWNVVSELRDSGVTVILTTHYIAEAEQMAGRVGIINNGEIILVQEKTSLMRELGKKQLFLHLQARWSCFWVRFILPTAAAAGSQPPKSVSTEPRGPARAPSGLKSQKMRPVLPKEVDSGVLLVDTS
jgi:hypothetical protein